MNRLLARLQAGGSKLLGLDKCIRDRTRCLAGFREGLQPG